MPNSDHYAKCLDEGDTLARRPHIHLIGSKLAWLGQQRQEGRRIVAVELADDATPLTRLKPANSSTVILLGHERFGVPEEAWPYVDEVIEIPMVGTGGSLNVAVAGSLVLYRLAGLA